MTRQEKIVLTIGLAFVVNWCGALIALATLP